jgi:pantetheine-phosphate adenylyltransferase
VVASPPAAPDLGSGRRPRLAVCPGSFDPVTSGHVDVVRRVTVLFEAVVVAVVRNHSKATLFDATERADLIRLSLAGDPATAQVRVDVVEDGLIADYAAAVGAVALVKGLRSGNDFAYEAPMALMNRHLRGVETVFVPGDQRYGHVSSSMIKEVARLGGDVAQFVPPPVLGPLLARVRRGECGAPGPR